MSENKKRPEFDDFLDKQCACGYLGTLDNWIFGGNQSNCLYLYTCPNESCHTTVSFHVKELENEAREAMLAAFSKMIDDNQTKKCSNCFEIKPITEFYRKLDRYQSRCKTCNAEVCRGYLQRSAPFEKIRHYPGFYEINTDIGAFHIERIKSGHWEIMIRPDKPKAFTDYWDTACTLKEAIALIEMEINQD